MARKRTAGPTDRELAILSVLWERGPSTVREVHEAMHPEDETGYTTTLKLMQIMVEKGLLVREEDDGRRQRGEGVPPLRFRVEPDAQRPFGPRPPSNRGQDARDTQGPGSPNAISSRLGTHDALATNRRRHIYRPALSEERTQKQLVQDLLDRVFAGSAEKLVLRALSARKVSPNELKRIRKMIEEMEEA